MYKSLIIFIFFPIWLFAQENYLNKDENIYGIITSENGTYLILDKGLMQFSKYDPYLEYYRMVYNDSTLINPNTEIKEEFNFKIVPFLAPNFSQQKIDFKEPQKLGLFLQTNEFGGMNLTKYAEQYLESLINN